MTPKTIANYGGPYADHEPLINPETDFNADKGNRVLEDTAQLTRTKAQALVRFTATATAAPTTVQPTFWDTVWGSGVDQKPTIDKIATGEYVVSFDASYEDALGVEETVAFKYASIVARTSNKAEDIRYWDGSTAFGSNTWYVGLKEANTLDDVTAGANPIECTLILY